MNEAPVCEQAGRKKTILDLLSGDAELRSKRELIEKVVEKNLPHIDDPSDIPEEFEACWLEEQALAFKKLAEEEGLDFEKLVGDYLFTSKQPLRNDVVEAMEQKPRLTDRASTAERIIDKIFNFIDTFISGAIGGWNGVITKGIVKKFSSRRVLELIAYSESVSLLPESIHCCRIILQYLLLEMCMELERFSSSFAIFSFMLIPIVFMPLPTGFVPIIILHFC